MGCAASTGATGPEPPVTAPAPPTVYLFAASQPARSVEMLLTAGNVAFKNVPVDLMKGEKCMANPVGSVPYIEDAAFGVSMGEGLAIMVHLCETRKELKPFYPSDPKVRATINYWLHWHHLGTRKSTMFFRAIFMSDDVAVHEAALLKVVPNFLYLEQALARQGTSYLAGESVTIADLALITEVDQLDAFMDLLFGDGLFPLLEAWRARMGQLPAYANNPGLAMVKGMAPMFAGKITAVKASLGPKLIDAVKALTAAAGAPAAVTAAVDTNADGVVTPAEVGAYLAKQAEDETEEKVLQKL